MGFSTSTYAMSKKYVAATADGLGAVKGAPCTIKSTERTDNSTIITFEWTSNSGAKQTAQIEVPDGIQGIPGPKGDKGDTGPKGAKGDAGGTSVSKIEQTTTGTNDGEMNIITVTLSNGQTTTFSVKNGEQGIQGPQGEKGDPFKIVKTYPTIADMDADFDSDAVKEGQFVMISSTIEEEDNAKLYVKGTSMFTFVTDLSGAQGIQGSDGVSVVSIQQTKTSPEDGGENEITITLSNGQTSILKVRNGNKGSDATVTVDTSLDPNSNNPIANKIVANTLSTVNAELNNKAPKESPVFTGSVSLGRKSGTTVGSNSIAIGSGVNSSGNSSFATGIDTEATQEASYAEGRWTTANSKAAHAEGFDCVAGGTDVTKGSSPIEAYDLGSAAHAEGIGTVAKGTASHSSGYCSKSVGNASHAEGELTTSNGAAAHVEGKQSTAQGNYSHAEGFLSKALNTSAHAEGYSTNAEGDSSHAEGSNTLATAHSSHAEGQRTKAMEEGAHAEGIFGQSLGKGSHVEGYGPRGIYLRKVDGQQGYLLLHQDKSKLPNWLNGYYWDAGIESTIDTNAYPLYGLGLYDTSDKTTLKATITKTYTVPTEEGYDLYAILDTNLDSEIEANPDKGFYIYYNKAIKTGSHAEGCSVALGDYAHAEGSITWAAGMAHSEGVFTAAMNSGAHAEGTRTVARGGASHTEGKYSQALATGSHAEGFHTTANKEYQHVQGKYNLADDTKVHIVGWGDGIEGSPDERKNIYTLDEEGNAIYAGDVTATAEDGSKASLLTISKLATDTTAGLMSMDDKKKLDGITASADSVTFSRSLSSGTKIGTIKINGTSTDIYAPQTNTLMTKTNPTGNGTFSMNGGYASGTGASVFGCAENLNANEASGDGSFVVGIDNKTNGKASFVEGIGNSATPKLVSLTLNESASVDYTEAFSGTINGQAFANGHGFSCPGGISFIRQQCGYNSRYFEGYVKFYNSSNQEQQVMGYFGIYNNDESYLYFYCNNIFMPRGTVIFEIGVMATVDLTATHIQGKYALIDNPYAHIVGNGSITNPSNAYTLDWEGNAEFAGDIGFHSIFFNPV